MAKEADRDDVLRKRGEDAEKRLLAKQKEDRAGEATNAAARAADRTAARKKAAKTSTDTPGAD